MAQNTPAKPIAADLDEVMRALARQHARADFARLKLSQETTEITGIDHE